ncbi:hypothetical protein ABT255_24345 [Streptomyces mirabilis]|uniref:nuclear transport factor 2 family protein n=1 Tax=Streptomyces mirabilis TaxID=68239 RepID=UPI003330F5D2
MAGAFPAVFPAVFFLAFGISWTSASPASSPPAAWALRRSPAGRPHPRYSQHNPAVGNGTGPLKQFLQQGTQGDASPTGGGGTRFGNTLADGDLVWVFSTDYVVADIFRVVDGKIIEHWDVAADGQ